MRWGVVKPQSLGPPASPLLPSLPLPYPPLRPPAPVPPPQLDKHNERRRKAEAEQKARMMDSGSDSPGASGRGTKAHRVSPYRGGGKGFANHASLMLGLGGSNGGDMADRLQQLVGEPGMQVRAWALGLSCGPAGPASRGGARRAW
jgi:hypothetical protein